MPAVEWPSRRDSRSQAATSVAAISGTSSRVTRWTGPDTEMPATTVPWESQTGAATATRPGSSSS